MVECLFVHLSGDSKFGQLLQTKGSQCFVLKKLLIISHIMSIYAVCFLLSSYGTDTSPFVIGELSCSTDYLTILQCSYSESIYCLSDFYDATVTCCKDMHTCNCYYLSISLLGMCDGVMQLRSTRTFEMYCTIIHFFHCQAIFIWKSKGQSFLQNFIS